MASSKRWSNLICSIAFSTYFFIIIFQVPIFRVPCRLGICKTPLEVTSSQLIASEVFPHFMVKALLYPEAFAKAIWKQKTIPSYNNLLNLNNFNTRAISAISDLQRLEVLVGSYLSVGGAITGLIRPGRMSLFGILLLMWGLIRESIMGKSGFTYSKAIHIYPTMYIALVSAFFSIKKDVRKIIRCYSPKHVAKEKQVDNYSIEHNGKVDLHIEHIVTKVEEVLVPGSKDEANMDKTQNEKADKRGDIEDDKEVQDKVNEVVGNSDNLLYKMLYMEKSMPLLMMIMKGMDKKQNKVLVQEPDQDDDPIFKALDEEKLGKDFELKKGMKFGSMKEFRMMVMEYNVWQGNKLCL
ncbi:hypothetical protein RJT34_16992 [Clitoria ternatea]|uniref:Uncharacterized protein n=1 Tax=Clitoria ternatea TaxID=43366 RepID=A0AAN9PE59_CLITE